MKEINKEKQFCKALTRLKNFGHSNNMTGLYSADYKANGIVECTFHPHDDNRGERISPGSTMKRLVRETLPQYGIDASIDQNDQHKCFIDLSHQEDIAESTQRINDDFVSLMATHVTKNLVGTIESQDITPKERASILSVIEENLLEYKHDYLPRQPFSKAELKNMKREGCIFAETKKAIGA